MFGFKIQGSGVWSLEVWNLGEGCGSGAHASCFRH